MHLPFIGNQPSIVRVLLIAMRYSILPDISYIVRLISSQALPKTQETRDKEKEKIVIQFQISTKLPQLSLESNSVRQGVREAIPQEKRSFFKGRVQKIKMEI